MGSHTLLVGAENGVAVAGSSLAVPQKAELPRGPAVLLWVCAREEEDLRPHKTLCTDAHSSAVHESRRAHTTQVPTSRATGAPCAVGPHRMNAHRVSALSHGKKRNSDAHGDVDEP